MLPCHTNWIHIPEDDLCLRVVYALCYKYNKTHMKILVGKQTYILQPISMIAFCVLFFFNYKMLTEHKLSYLGIHNWDWQNKFRTALSGVCTKSMLGLRVEPKVISDIRIPSVHHHKQKKKKKENPSCYHVLCVSDIYVTVLSHISPFYWHKSRQLYNLWHSKVTFKSITYML